METAYLWKWWKRQHDVVKHQFLRFIRNGQLEIIGGAWSMNDEAVTHYQSIIDQFTWGLRYYTSLKNFFSLNLKMNKVFHLKLIGLYC